MKKILFILCFYLLLLPVDAQENQGIQFFEGNLEEAATLAKKQHKKIFIDFYTSWCGPCKKMLKQVFPQPEVGEFFNKHFISLKINAEKGEGRKLSAKYQVNCFPTYIYLNPKNMEIIHRSKSNKPADRFIQEAKGALDPKLSSIYLSEKYGSGKYSAEDLINYIYYKKFSGDGLDFTEEFSKLFALGVKKTDARVWKTFRECVDGTKNPYLNTVSSNYNEFVRLFGQQEVDKKLFDITAYANTDFLNGMCEFQGKDYRMKVIKMHELFRTKKTDEAWDYTEELTKDKTLDQDMLLKDLQLTCRVEPQLDALLTFEQLIKKVRCCQFVTYNWKDRKDYEVHYNYARALEYLILRSVKEGKAIPPEFISEPVHGNKKYSLR